jgi:hypothetical protein
MGVFLSVQGTAGHYNTGAASNRDRQPNVGVSDRLRVIYKFLMVDQWVIWV